MKQQEFVLQNKGMNRDLSISKAGESAAYENRNIRILATDKDTMLSVTNERGNKKVEDITFEGELLGYGVLNSYVILFTADSSKSYIYRVELLSDTFRSILIFSGDLGFNTNSPIETILDYETEDIQKIYWLDGVHVLRFLNFSDTYLEQHLVSGSLYDSPVFSFAEDNTWFDSTRPSRQLPTVTIEKDNSGSSRPNGVAQYFLTYYNKNGQQTGIIYSSPLVYLSPTDRGGAADGTNNNRVTLTVTNLDSTYDYVRLYQILRTAINGQYVAYIIGESSIINDEALFVDDGAHYTAIDASSLLYLGSQNLVAGTMTQKDGTLFLGNLKSVGNKSVDQLEEAIKQNAFDLLGEEFVSGVDWESNLISFQRSTTKDLSSQKNHIPYVYAEGYYPYDNQLQYTNAQITTFKGGEKYRFALRFVRSNGTMSKSFWIGDKVNPYYPQMRKDNAIARVIAVCTIPDEIVEAAQEADFVSVQLMVAEATYADRSVQAQGILSPTVFNLYNRYSRQAFSQSSWVFRAKNGAYPNMHMSPLLNSNDANAELQCSNWSEESVAPTPFYYTDDNNELINKPDGYNYGVAISVKVTIHAVKFITKYIGKIEIKYFATLGDSDDKAIRTYTKQIGSEGAIYHNSLLRILRDWLQAYEDADVPVTNRATTDTMRKVCKKALDRAVYALVYAKAGEAVYQLNESEEDNHQVLLDFRTLDYAHLYSKTNRQYFFIDESVLTFNSPEIEQQAVSLDRNTGLKLRIVGAAKMTGNLTDYTVTTENTKSPGEHLINYDFSHQNISEKSEGLSAWPCYLEYAYHSSGTDTYQRLDTTYSYMLYMWNRSGSIPSFGDDDTLWSILKTKRFANLHFSMYSVFNDYQTNGWSVTPDDIRQLSDVGATIYELKRGTDTDLYVGNVNDLIVMPATDVKYPIYASKHESLPDSTLSLTEMKTVNDPISITYNSKAHIAISLPVSNGVETILPYLYNSDAFKLDELELKTEEGTAVNVNGPFAPWMKASYSNKKLLYRTVDSSSSTDLNDLTVGAFSQFTVLEKSTDSAMITMLSSISDKTLTDDSLGLLDSLQSAVTENFSGKTVYAHLITSDNTVLMADVSDLSIVTTNVEMLFFPNYAGNYIKFSSNVTMSDIYAELYIVSSDGTKGLAASYHYDVETTEKQFDLSKTIYATSGKLLLKFKIQYTPSYTGSDSTVKSIVPVLNSDDFDAFSVIIAIFGARKSEEYRHAAYIEKAAYIDPTATRTESVEFINVATTPNEYIVLGTDNKFTYNGQYSSLFRTPLQQKYKLTDTSALLSEGDKYLFIGELYKDYDAEAEENPMLDIRYGGITESAIESNTFIEAGPRTDLTERSTVDGYAKATIDCDYLFDYLCNVTDFSNVYFNIGITSSKPENIVLSSLNQLSVNDFIPTSTSKVSTLGFTKDSAGNYISTISELTDAQTTLVANSSDYKVVILRYGYARRGKWRTFKNKYGDTQTSHTTRTPEYKTKRVGYNKSLEPKRYRIIGNDLLISSKSISAQSASSTWKTGGGRNVDYTKATLVSALGTALVLPELPSNYTATLGGHYADLSRNGITDLYLGLYHKESGTWKLASNIVQVRGRNADRTQIWEFDKTIRDAKKESAETTDSTI